MSLRNFRQLFAIVFTLITAVIAYALSLQIRWPQIGGLQSYEQLIREMPSYRPFMIGATTVLGLLLGAIMGPKIASRLVSAGNALDRMSARDKIAVTLGTVIGILITVPFLFLFSKLPGIGLPLSLLLCLVFVYLGIRAAMGMKDEFLFVARPGSLVGHDGVEIPIDHCKLLDTNVIIDGRIADICRAGFVEGTIYVPGFVLDELQYIADSADSLKRARGRRGLDILNAMQKELPLVVRSLDHKLGSDVGLRAGVDTRLVSLAKQLNGSIVTNDFNLNKVAALQGVQVLNVNELANALKPVVLPGEAMKVTVIREGKEPGQGVAYLDDGTMIVVEDGRACIGENVEVTVSSVIQTLAGKMIFARVQECAAEGEETHEGSRSRAGGGQRNKVR